MSQITKQLALRLPLDLHAKVVATAAENNRSGHAEMLKRLEESFDGQAETLNTDEVMRVFGDVARRTVEVCFSKLEERVAAMLDRPSRQVYSVTLSDGGTSAADMGALRAYLKSSGSYSQLSDLYQHHFSNFDLRGLPLPASPTGRLSESQPELQDMPAVSGMSTLAASLKNKGCMRTGGFTGLPEGELPQILEKGERVQQHIHREFQSTVTVFNHALLAERGWVENGGVCPVDGDARVEVLFRGGGDSIVIQAKHVRWDRLDNEKVDVSYWRLAAPKPFTRQAWVITGSLDTMTRDRAREIIMELGGIVAGKVDRTTDAVLRGPGAGSKLVTAGVLGIPTYTERQFIELIRSHGVDMPLPDVDDNVWTTNVGRCPSELVATPYACVEVELRDGQTSAGPAGDMDWSHDKTSLPYKNPKEIFAWRLVK